MFQLCILTVLITFFLKGHVVLTFVTALIYCLGKTLVLLEEVRKHEKAIEEAYREEPEFVDFVKHSSWTFFVFFFCTFSLCLFYVVGFSYAFQNLGAFLVR